jgi:hypothetical protein
MVTKRVKHRRVKRKAGRVSRRHHRRRKVGRVSRRHHRRRKVGRVSRRHHRRRFRRKMRGGAVHYTPSKANFSNVNEVVPYKVGKGIEPGQVSNGVKNHYSLSKDIHGQNNWVENTSLGTSIPATPQKGGGGLSALVPQDLLNLYRDSVSEVGNLYDGYVGQTAPLSSNPNVMKQGLKSSKLDIMPPNINAIQTRSDKLAASV